MDYWILVVILLVAMPVFGLYRFQALGRLPDPPPTRAKLRLYATAVLVQWSLVVYSSWVLQRRDTSLEELGLGVAGATWSWLIALALASALILATVQSVGAIRNLETPDIPDHIRRLFRILPIKPVERFGFVLVGFTAGFCEEILYRGFLIHAFNQLFPNTAVSVVVAGIAFGFGHLYQGRQGIVVTGILGIALGAVYVLSGSLWPGILVHTAIDLANGHSLGKLAGEIALRPAASKDLQGESGEDGPGSTSMSV